MIRNYLGFPCGISGASLANRAFEQAWSFGVTPAVAGPVTALRPGAVPAAALVVLIGAVPRTGWLPASIRCDRQDAPRRAVVSGSTRGTCFGTSFLRAMTLSCWPTWFTCLRRNTIVIS
jgi:hypothetical protein